MARRKESSRYEQLAARRHLPQVVREIDEALEDMRHEYLDLLDLRGSVIRRHGDQGETPLVPPFMQAEAQKSPATGPGASAPKKSMTLEEMWSKYTSHPESPFHKLGYKSKVQYETLGNLILKEHSKVLLYDVSARVLNEWHASWGEGGKTAVSHAKIGMLRRLFAFGATVLEDPDCLRLSTILHTLRFKMPKRRTERLTSNQAVAIRAKARELGRKSLALAQALQFELGLRQVNVIGEWVPTTEAGESDIEWNGFKWMKGIRWSDIDENMVLNFSIAGQPNPLNMALRQCPMILEELTLSFGFDGSRSSLDKDGPMIVSEFTKRPWETPEFRRWWRQLANACGVPKHVRNMDSRVKIGRRPSQHEDEEEELEIFESGEEMSLH